ANRTLSLVLCPLSFVNRLSAFGSGLGVRSWLVDQAYEGQVTKGLGRRTKKNEDHTQSRGLAKFSRAAFADLVRAHGARGAGRSNRARAFHGARPSRRPQSGAGSGQAAAPREGIDRAGGRSAERS